MKKIFLVFALIISLSASAFAFNGVQWQMEASVTSNLAIHENLLLFGDSSGFCYAVNKNTGRPIWSYNSAGASIIGTPAVFNDKESKVLFVAADGTMTCLSLYDGSLIWNYDPQENKNEAVNDGSAAGAGLFFVVKDDAKLYALDSETGRRVWTYKASDQGLRTSPAYSDGLIFLGEYNGIFNILDAKSGKRINGGGAGGAVNTPTINNGNVYFSSWDGSVQAVKIKSVIPLWNTNLKDPITTAPVISNGIIAVGTGRGLLIVLDEENGEMIWNFDPHNGGFTANPVIANGKVFACPEGGNVYELNAKTGRQIDKFETDEINVSPAYSDGVFYFAGDGKVIALSE